MREIVSHPYFMLATDMGGMKTAQTIIAAQLLAEAGAVDRVIVVCPASVRPVWYDRDLGQLAEQLWMSATIREYHQRIRAWKHAGTPLSACCQYEVYETKDERTCRSCGAGQKRPFRDPTLDWIITNYEYVRRPENVLALLPLCGPRTMLVLDESSAIKSHKSRQYEACLALRKACGRVLLLNGTPIANSPLDLFAQGNLMHKGILECPYITRFKAHYATQEAVMAAGGRPLLDAWNRPVQRVAGWTNIPDLQRRFAPYVLRREAKSLGIDFALPPVPIEVTLTPATWKIYKDMRDDMIAWLKSGDVAVTQTAAIRALRLAQITSGFVGGVEPGSFTAPGEDDMPPDVASFLDGVAPHPDYVRDLSDGDTGPLHGGIGALPTREIGREKLDFALAWHRDLLERAPDLKLLAWCRFVPELRRYLAEVAALGPPVGAICGQPMLGRRVKEEREDAIRLLHPRTAPPGPATVGGTYGTGALGLNLTACRTVIDMSYDFSPWKKLQGDARVNRPGQTGPVSFHYLIAVGPRGQKTIDHHIIMSRLGKTDIARWTVSAWVRALEEE